MQGENIKILHVYQFFPIIAGVKVASLFFGFSKSCFLFVLSSFFFPSFYAPASCFRHSGRILQTSRPPLRYGHAVCNAPSCHPPRLLRIELRKAFPARRIRFATASRFRREAFARAFRSPKLATGTSRMATLHCGSFSFFRFCFLL
jgi:hypothetical protein